MSNNGKSSSVEVYKNNDSVEASNNTPTKENRKFDKINKMRPVKRRRKI